MKSAGSAREILVPLFLPDHADAVLAPLGTPRKPGPAHDGPVQIAPPHNLRMPLRVPEHVGLQPLEQKTESLVHELRPVPRVPNPRPRKADEPPCSFIAATMFSVPFICTSFGEVFVCPRTLSTASVPETVSPTRAASRTSPHHRKPLVFEHESLAGSRTRALTSCPSASACSRSGRPVLPDAPKTASLIRPQPSFRSEGVCARS